MLLSDYAYSNQSTNIAIEQDSQVQHSSHNYVDVYNYRHIPFALVTVICVHRSKTKKAGKATVTGGLYALPQNSAINQHKCYQNISFII